MAPASGAWAAAWGGSPGQVSSEAALVSMASETRDDYQPMSHGDKGYLRLMRSEDPQDLINQAIAWENWETWRIFQASPGEAVPLMAAQLYIFYSSESDEGKRSRIQAVYRVAKAPPPPESWRYFRLSIPHRNIWGSLLHMDEIQDSQMSLGQVSWLSEPMGWLSEDDGLFSGRPWDWENALQRVGTICLLAVGFLLLMEFLRLVVSLGMRALGRRVPGARV